MRVLTAQVDKKLENPWGSGETLIEYDQNQMYPAYHDKVCIVGSYLFLHRVISTTKNIDTFGPSLLFTRFAHIAHLAFEHSRSANTTQ